MTDSSHPYIVVTAVAADFSGYLALAAEVEDWFGPMVADPGFHQSLAKNIARGTAICVRAGDGAAGAPLLGGLIFSPRLPEFKPELSPVPVAQLRLGWLVVSSRSRRGGVGRALVACALRRMPRPLEVSVLTFGAGHPAAGPARCFFESFGFQPAELAPDGPEGGARQVFRLFIPAESAGR